jgi:hypothetical protein
LACLNGTVWLSGDPVCLWIPGLTGFGGVCSPAEGRLWVCRSLACRVNIVQGYVGLGGMAQWTEIVCVCISSAAGLGGVYQQSRDLAGLCWPWGAWPNPMEIMCVCISGEAGLGTWAGRADLSGLCRPWGHGWESRDCAWLGSTAQ